jgi:hypothetical protein
MDKPTRPNDWTAELTESAAEIERGDTTPLNSVLAELRTAAAALETRLAARAPKRTNQNR